MDFKKFNLSDWIKLIVFVFCILVSPLLIIKHTREAKIQHANQIESLFGNIYFEGKVVGFNYIKHSGMPSAAIMCIKMDSSNVDSFYHFDKYTALKIENGIATFPIGSYDKSTNDTLFKKTVFVIINKDGNHKMLFISNDNDTIVEQMYYTSVDIKESDLIICDTCQ